MRSLRTLAYTVACAFACVAGLFIGSQGTAMAADSVVLQLKWKHQFQFAGYYVAREKGFYRDAGLDVKILEADTDHEPVADVIAGRAEFGIAGSELAMLRAQGKPVVVVAAIIQHSPLVLLTQENIDSIQDLAGKKVMLLPQETEAFAYLKREGITPDKITIIPHNFQLADLVQGHVDAMSAYSTDEPFALRQSKFAFHQFTPRSSGIDFYGDSIFTSDAYLKQHPAQVAAFREASIQGWRYALDHPEETADLILQRYTHRHTRDHLLSEAAEIHRLMYPELIDIGHSAPGRWHHIADVYAEVGLLPQASDINGLLYDPRAIPSDAWIKRSLTVTLAVFLILVVVAWRFQRVGHRLTMTLSERDAALRNLQDSKQRLRTVFNGVPVAVIVWSGDYLVSEWNLEAERTFGWSSEEICDQSFLKHLIPPEEQQNFKNATTAAFASGAAGRSTLECLTRDNHRILCSWSHSPLISENGEPVAMVSAITDITLQVGTASALRESEQRYRTLVEIAPFPVVVTRISDNTVVLANKRGADRFGVDLDSAIGMSAPDYWVNPEERTKLVRILEERGVVFDYEAELKTAKGERFWAYLSAILIPKLGGESQVFVSFNDITARKQAELDLRKVNMDLQLRLLEILELRERLENQAIRDSLTGLYNRHHLDDTFERELARARREGMPLAVVLLDVDHFKQLNDTYGHRAGDTVLKAMAALLSSDVRAEDFICRYGGEEFLVILPGMGLDIAAERAERWRVAIAEMRVPVRSTTLQITGSFGIASYPDQGLDADRLIQAADTALYRAKHNGRNRVELAQSPESA
ncbi:MAG TPA: diguanylate cyclase [Rhodocyclaceae bacterium]|nr:diguanylate cyclase [Rhodocyclaceae bacterium]